MSPNRLEPYLEQEVRSQGPSPEAGSWEDYLSGKCRDLRKTVEQKIAQSPVVSVGAALAVGVLVGWLIKRR